MNEPELLAALMHCDPEKLRRKSLRRIAAEIRTRTAGDDAAIQRELDALGFKRDRVMHGPAVRAR